MGDMLTSLMIRVFYMSNNITDYENYLGYHICIQ